MMEKTNSIITPEFFKLPELEQTVFLFFLMHHFFLFHEITNGSKVRSYGPARRFNFTSSGQDYSVLGGFIGAPLSVIIAENAFVSGARKFISFGTAGCIGSSDLEIGDLVRPAGAWDKTGMIRDYEGTSDFTEFRYRQNKPNCRNVVSVNSFYRLTPQNLEQYRQQEVDIIDMEAAPLNYVLLSKGADFFPLFAISDKVLPDSSWQYENRGSRIQKGVEEGLQQILPKST